MTLLRTAGDRRAGAGLGCDPARTAGAGRTASDNVVEYSPQLLDRLRADNRVVFVNMTADCVSCKAKRARRAVAAGIGTAQAHQRGNMRGDYTNVEITTFLEEHKASRRATVRGVRPGAPPTVLPTLLTQAVEEALLRTAR